MIAGERDLTKKRRKGVVVAGWVLALAFLIYAFLRLCIPIEPDPPFARDWIRVRTEIIRMDSDMDPKIWLALTYRLPANRIGIAKEEALKLQEAGFTIERDHSSWTDYKKGDLILQLDKVAKNGFLTVLMGKELPDNSLSEFRLSVYKNLFRRYSLDTLE